MSSKESFDSNNSETDALLAGVLGLYDSQVINEDVCESGVKIRDENGNEFVMGDAKKNRWEDLFPHLPEHVLDLEEVKEAANTQDLINVLNNHDDEDIKSLLWKKTSTGDTPLHLAIKKDYKNVLPLLISTYTKKALSAKDASGNTALHLAAFLRQGHVIRAMNSRATELDNTGKFWLRLINKKNACHCTPFESYYAADQYAVFFFKQTGVSKAKDTTRNLLTKKERELKKLMKDSMNVQRLQGEFSLEKFVEERREWSSQVAVILDISLPREKLKQLSADLVENDDQDASDKEEVKANALHTRLEKSIGHDEDIDPEILLDMYQYLRNKYDGEVVYRQYFPVKYRFINGDLLASTQEFILTLAKVYDVLKADLLAKEEKTPGVFHEDKFNKIFNELKADIYNDILKKQEELRAQRWKNAWILTAVLIPLFPVIPFVWYWWHKDEQKNEALSAEVITDDDFLTLYQLKNDEGEEKLTAQRVLERLERREPLSNKSKTNISDEESEEESFNSKADDSVTSLLGDSAQTKQPKKHHRVIRKAHRAVVPNYTVEKDEKFEIGDIVFNEVKIISTTWNGQALRFTEKLSKIQHTTTADDNYSTASTEVDENDASESSTVSSTVS